MINKIWQHKNIKESFLGAVKGLGVVLKTERNARTIFIIGILVIISGFIFAVSFYKLTILIIVIMIVFICEVFNTMCENILDLIKPQTDPKIKILKDISSGAVLLSSLGAVIIGVLIFLPKIIQ